MSMNSLSKSGERTQTPLAVHFELLRRLPLARWAPIPLRLIVKYGFMAHGYAKLMKGVG